MRVLKNGLKLLLEVENGSFYDEDNQINLRIFKIKSIDLLKFGVHDYWIEWSIKKRTTAGL
jgi:hypothetical protein